MYLKRTYLAKFGYKSERKVSRFFFNFLRKKKQIYLGKPHNVLTADMQNKNILNWFLPGKSGHFVFCFGGGEGEHLIQKKSFGPITARL
jgi:hypothetical protein